VALATATALLLALAVGTALVWRERQGALRQRDEARLQGRRAEENFRKARQAVDDYFSFVSENTLLQEPALEPLRKQLLEAALRYYQEFAREHGDAPDLQAELVAVYFRIAVLIHDLGAEEDWLPAFRKGVDIMEELLRKNPRAVASPSLQAGVYRVNSSANVRIRKPDDALRAFEKARTLWGRLAREHPEAPGYRNELALFHRVIGGIHNRAGRAEEALQSLRESLVLLRDLVRTDPAMPHYRASLILSLHDVSIVLADMGRLPQAEEAIREALVVANRLAADFPAVPAWKDLLTRNLYDQLGTVMEYADRLRDAEEAYRQMLAGQESLLRLHPTVARYQEGVLRARLYLGEVAWAMGHPEEAAREFRRVQDLEGMPGPADLGSRWHLAWFLATAADPRFRDARRAVELAKSLVETEPDDGSHWLALGAAHYRMGDDRAAVAALERATLPPDEDDRLVRLFLAMAYRRLGEKDRARKLYDSVVSRMEHGVRIGVKLRRIRAEAEAALGVGKRADDL
jgi:tetratricopeptide (TPR) repeat protein